MIRLGTHSTITFLLAMFAGVLHVPAATNSTPAFTEVYDSIRAHMTGAEDAELNRAAVAGLLKELGPKASLVTGGPAGQSATVVTQLVSKAWVFDDHLAYLRIARVGDGLAAQLRAACQPLGQTNQLNGVVLDLRFADGTDYADVAAVAELFTLKTPATLDWGKGSQESKSGPGLFSVPLIALVNRGTQGAAEALAALLREAGGGLILGSQTAGHALLTQDFPLKDGTLLRLATASVKLNGLELAQVRPDIEVAVSATAEQNFYTDSFAVLPKPELLADTNKLAGTNSSGRRLRLTEAELVRAHKQGLNPAGEEDGLGAGKRETKSEAPLVSDPVLARALDLLKGLAIVRQSQP